MSRFRKPLVALLSACLIAGTACSSSSKSASSGPKSSKNIAETFKLASTKTLDAETMHFSLRMDIPQVGQMTGEGSQDFKAGVLAMTLNMPSFAAGVPAVTMEQVLSGTTMYIRSDLFSAALPPGKSWMKLDLATLGSELGVDFAALFEQSRDADPRTQLSFLEAAGSGAQELGSSEIRGVKTTHYKFVIDLAKVSAELPDEVKALVQDAAGSEMPAEAWIDGDGLVRRLTYTMQLPAAEAGAPTGPLTTSMDFFDFGSPVNVKVPSDAESIDFMQALGALG